MKIKSTKIPYRPELIDEEEFKDEVILDNKIKNIDDQRLKDTLISNFKSKNLLNRLEDVIRGVPEDLSEKGLKDSETLKDIDRRIKNREAASDRIRRHDKYFPGESLSGIHGTAGSITLTPNFGDYDFEKGEFGSDELDFLADYGNHTKFDRLRKKLK